MLLCNSAAHKLLLTYVLTWLVHVCSDTLIQVGTYLLLQVNLALEAVGLSLLHQLAVAPHSSFSRFHLWEEEQELSQRMEVWEKEMIPQVESDVPFHTLL